jgi:CrcB protein
VTRFLWVCLAGALGSGARYLVSGWMADWLGPKFPWGTLAVNLIGSFLIAAIMDAALRTDLVSPTMRLVLTTGFLGGFTTYSAFSYETTRLLQDGAWWLAFLNVAATVAGCLAACFLGFALSKWALAP